MISTRVASNTCYATTSAGINWLDLLEWKNSVEEAQDVIWDVSSRQMSWNGIWNINVDDDRCYGTRFAIPRNRVVGFDLEAVNPYAFDDTVFDDTKKDKKRKKEAQVSIDESAWLSMACPEKERKEA